MAEKNELIALSLRSEINANHREAIKTATDTIGYATKAGELLVQVKSLLPHGGFEKWISQNCDFSYDVASGYMRLHKRLEGKSKVVRAQLLTDARSVTNLQNLLKPEENTTSPPKNRPPSGSATSGKSAPKDEPKDKPKDYGKCPNCAGTKWSEDEEGVSCAKCHHPHGEPAGDVDDKQVSIQRSKTIKTVEALMRAFDDLQTICANGHHDAAIEGCKALLRMARAWK